ncbi:uncharacterized protein LY79DRAFT_349194 [Colletotrichum navitas]|uniref:Uncharacterized protein n=1 Tax=Colletotrichum navitas TaxID=681940 RepID=A0AAD8V7X2_9PEZI|nr:uncharacterized protein LY79DRAFT_349194 [Colletotrichum navitas]KAK1597587.1 hypothetical protein LY79DRAFT_349194 [Colletotrichum navitas]
MNVPHLTSWRIIMSMPAPAPTRHFTSPRCDPLFFSLPSSATASPHLHNHHPSFFPRHSIPVTPIIVAYPTESCTSESPMPSHLAGLPPRNVTTDSNHSRHHHDILLVFSCTFPPLSPRGHANLSETVQLNTYTHTPAGRSQRP